MRLHDCLPGPALVLLALGCSETAPKPTASASAAVSSAPSGAKLGAKLPPTAGSAGAPKKKWAVPTGPRLAVVAGVGVGPIRLGATVATIERHMDLKCPELSEKSCRYVTRAVEFFLDDKGAVNRIAVHRAGRPAAPATGGAKRNWGIFNGGFREGVQLGMILDFSKATLGKPTRIEKVDSSPKFHTQEQHHYDGMILQYDTIPESKKTVLGGIVIVPKGKK